jgi:hypothetical protein
MILGRCPKPRPRRKAGGLYPNHFKVGFWVSAGLKGQDELASLALDSRSQLVANHYGFF